MLNLGIVVLNNYFRSSVFLNFDKNEGRKILAESVVFNTEELVDGFVQIHFKIDGKLIRIDENF